MALAAVAAAVAMAASACGGGSSDSGNGGNGGNGGDSAITVTLTPPDEAVEPGEQPDFAGTFSRPRRGIAAAGGNPDGAADCETVDGSAGAEAVRLAYVGPALDELDALGLETLVFDDPLLTLNAYANSLNLTGGLGPRCVELLPYVWSLADPVTDLGRICTELPREQPLLVVSLGLEMPVYECLALAAALPVLTVYGGVNDEQFAAAGGRLFSDSGSHEHVLGIASNVSTHGGIVRPDDRIGVMHRAGASVERENDIINLSLAGHGAEIVSGVEAPAEFSELSLLLAERDARLLETGLDDDERAAARAARDALPAEQAAVLDQMEQFYTASASRMKADGVTAVIVSAAWQEARRMMRAATLVDWYPKWVISDSQPASLVLSGTPAEQGRNLVQVSGRRSAGDEIPDLDRECLTMRNTASEGPVFPHRVHTDAWQVLMALCDYLDVAMAAASRVTGPLTSEEFVAQMHQIDYATPAGPRIRFSEDAPFGAVAVRALTADPACVLDAWGCMRAVWDWQPLAEDESYLASHAAMVASDPGSAGHDHDDE